MMAETAPSEGRCLVVDSCFPLFLGTIAPSPQMDSETGRMIADGESPEVIHRRAEAILEEDLVTPTSLFWEVWRTSGVTAIHATVGDLGRLGPEEGRRELLRQLAVWTRRFDTHPALQKITRVKDLDEAYVSDRFGVILGVQNPTCIGRDLENLELLSSLGIRVFQLTYNLRSDFGDGCTERVDAGLSELGIQAIRRLNRLRVLIDASHCGKQTTLEAIDQSATPVAVTHAACAELYPHPRNKSDEELRALGSRGGYLGVLLIGDFLARSGANLSLFVDHIVHASSILGVDHVGIGSDIGMWVPEGVRELRWKIRRREITEHGVSVEGWRADSLIPYPPQRIDGFSDWRDMRVLPEVLRRRGFREAEIRGIVGGNFRRVFETVVG